MTILFAAIALAVLAAVAYFGVKAYRKSKAPGSPSVEPPLGYETSPAPAPIAVVTTSPVSGTATTSVASGPILAPAVIALLGGNHDGNAPAGYVPSTFDARSLIQDGPVITNFTGVKYRAPSGSRAYFFTIPAKTAAYVTSSEVNGGILTMTLKNSGGTEIAKDTGGAYPELIYDNKTDSDIPVTLECNYTGSNDDGGIEVHFGLNIPDTSHLGA
jgi:uncharacterized protein (UPF0333 family)